MNNTCRCCKVVVPSWDCACYWIPDYKDPRPRGGEGVEMSECGCIHDVGIHDRFAELEDIVASLRAEVERLKAELAETKAQRDRLRGLLRESLPILAAFRNKNPRWTDREFGPQDPYGVHALVPRIRKELGEGK